LSFTAAICLYGESLSFAVTLCFDSDSIAPVNIESNICGTIVDIRGTIADLKKINLNNFILFREFSRPSQIIY